METLFLVGSLASRDGRKYLTYKEWKQNGYVSAEENPAAATRKYLTYKEWKQISVHILPSRQYTLEKCKYLTYKEWKHSCLSSRYHNKIVSTLPIRNGNSLLQANFLLHSS